MHIGWGLVFRRARNFYHQIDSAVTTNFYCFNLSLKWPLLPIFNAFPPQNHPTQITDDPNPAAPQTRKSWPRNALLAFARLWTRALLRCRPPSATPALIVLHLASSLSTARGRGPSLYPIWNGALGQWCDGAGNAQPPIAATSRTERMTEQQRRRRNGAAGARDRDAAHGREYVGHHVRRCGRRRAAVDTRDVRAWLRVSMLVSWQAEMRPSLGGRGSS